MSFRILRLVASALILVGAWSAATYGWGIPDYLLPGPVEVFSRLISDSPLIISNLFSTLLVAGLGAMLAVAVAALLALYSYLFARKESSFIGVLILLQSVPVVVLAPVLNVWFGNAIYARIFIAALFGLFPMAISLARALQEVPRDLLAVAHAAGGSKLQMLRFVLFPWALGGFFTGLRVALPLCLVGSIVAELSGSDRGIGYMMQVAQRRLDGELLFSGVLIAALAGMILYVVIVAIERWLTPWRSDAAAA